MDSRRRTGRPFAMMELGFATNVKQWVDQSKLQWIRFQHRADRTSTKPRFPTMTATSSLDGTKDIDANFQIHAWRWHHLGIVHDLKRFQIASRKHSSILLCPPSSSSSTTNMQRLHHVTDDQRRIQAALRYILVDNWGVHNIVEETLLYPWLQTPPSSSSFTTITPLQLPSSIISERTRLRTQAESISTQFQKCCKTHNDVTMLLDNVDTLTVNAERLFEASEALIMSHVAQYYSAKEQKIFNDRVLSNLSNRQMRVAAVAFRDAVDVRNRKATNLDRRNFQSTLPSIVRGVAIPYWKSKFVKREIAFLEGEPLEGLKK